MKNSKTDSLYSPIQNSEDFVDNLLVHYRAGHMVWGKGLRGDPFIISVGDPIIVT